MAFNFQLQVGSFNAYFGSDNTSALFGMSPLLAPPYNFPRSKPGNIELLWNSNFASLYHRLSPYGYGNISKEPFEYRYPDDGVNTQIKNESILKPVGSVAVDVDRVTKFINSSRGSIFLSNQNELQKLNSYNETRLYDSDSVIAAAGLPTSGKRPTRFIVRKSAPPGTLVSSLPPIGIKNDRGLLRPEDANRSLSMLNDKWDRANGDTKARIANKAQSMFANTVPKTQQGISVRSDEGTYGKMVDWGGQPYGDGSTHGFGYTGATSVFDFMQRWVGGGIAIRKKSEYPPRPGIMVDTLDGVAKVIYTGTYTKSLININGTVGVPITPSTNELKPGVRYDDAHFPKIQDDVKGSDVMLGWSEYENPANKFPSKKTDAKSAEIINASLKSVIYKIKESNDGKTYQMNVPPDSSIIRPGTSEVNGYDRLMKTVNKNAPGAKPQPLQYPLGVLSQYRKTGVSLTDNSIANDKVNASYKLPTSGRFDAINTLNVLNSSRQISHNLLDGWNTWEPYKDDLIAFYFYDVVNAKFIPFRATIKGLSESGASPWEELSFINRADKGYSYTGFTRNLSVSFHIEISSIVELAPTYQRVNYLMTLIKPANYTYTAGSEDMNRFMVPPMVMITIGDLYKDQPVLIQTVTATIPDDASWETLSEYSGITEWNYLAKYITSPGTKFGQLPRSIDVALTMVLLEKERAIVGGANFSHAPRKTDKNQNWIPYNTDTPLGQDPKNFGKSLVVNVRK